jgi:hypothetical protein
MPAAALYPEPELRALLPFEHFNYVKPNVKLIMQIHAKLNKLSEIFMAYPILNNYSHFQRVLYRTQI